MNLPTAHVPSVHYAQLSSADSGFQYNWPTVANQLMRHLFLQAQMDRGLQKEGRVAVPELQQPVKKDWGSKTHQVL